MGVFDFLGDVQEYFNERFRTTGDAYLSAWKSIPDAWKQQQGGLWTLAQTPFSAEYRNKETASRAVRSILDGTVGMGGALLSGTIGGAFELPGLHEGATLIDKIYRYTIQYPQSYYWGGFPVAMAEMERAKQEGRDPQAAYMEALLSHYGQGPWGSDARSMTWGQAMMFTIGTGLNSWRGNDAATEWALAHDPRDPEGLAKYVGDITNPNEYEFMLKYGSGSIDFLAAIAGDPTIPIAGAVRTARFRRSNVATERYIANGGVEHEINGEVFERVYEAAQEAPAPEVLRERVMPNARFGGRASVLLWAAAHIEDPVRRRQIFTDTYVVMRGMDGLWRPAAEAGGAVRLGAAERPSALGMLGARERLVESAPVIATEMARLFANWNIGEDALAFGRDTRTTRELAPGQEVSSPQMSLAMTDTQAFIISMTEREGIWGRMQGILVDEAQPKVTRLRDLRLGLHRNILAGQTAAQVRVGRLPATFMFSQGYTPFIDLEDSTAISLKNFKALLERSGMASDRVESWVSQWAAKGERQGRGVVLERATEEAIATVAARHGLDATTVKESMPEIMQHMRMAQAIMSGAETYFTDRVARAGAANVARNVQSEITDYRKQMDPKKQDREGRFGERAHVIPAVDGAIDLLIEDTRDLPKLASDASKPLLQTQQRVWAPTIDFRALDGQLRWYRWSQISPTLPRRKKGAKGKDYARFARDVTLAGVSRLQGTLMGTISKADFLNMVWKSFALLRPAQMPRNLADDVMRRLIIFGRLPLLLGTMRGSKRAVQNLKSRLKLAHEARAESRASSRASGRNVAEADGEYDGDAPITTPDKALADKIRQLNRLLKQKDRDEAEAMSLAAEVSFERGLIESGGAMSITQAWVRGIVGWDDFVEALEGWAGHPLLETRMTDDVSAVYSAYTAGHLALPTVADPIPARSPHPKFETEAVKQRLLSVAGGKEIYDDFGKAFVDEAARLLERGFTPAEVAGNIRDRLEAEQRDARSRASVVPLDRASKIAALADELDKMQREPPPPPTKQSVPFAQLPRPVSRISAAKVARRGREVLEKTYARWRLPGEDPKGVPSLLGGVQHLLDNARPNLPPEFLPDDPSAYPSHPLGVAELLETTWVENAPTAHLRLNKSTGEWVEIGRPLTEREIADLQKAFRDMAKAIRKVVADREAGQAQTPTVPGAVSPRGEFGIGMRRDPLEWLGEEPGKARRVSGPENVREFKRLLLLKYFASEGKHVRFLESSVPGTMNEVIGPGGLRGEVTPDDISPRALARKQSNIAVWIEEVIGAHLSRLSKRDEITYAPGHMIVDPFSGKRKKMPGLDSYTLVKHKTFKDVHTQDMSPHGNLIRYTEEFILDNLDEMMRPDTVLSISVAPDGTMRVAAARSRVIEDIADIKGTAWQRIKNFPMEGIKDAASERVKVKLPDGRTLEFHAALEGEEGQPFRHRISAEVGSGAWQFLVGDYMPFRLMDAEGGWATIMPGAKGYAQSWERAVNAELRGDPVAEMFLRGRTDSDIIHWLEHTRDGAKWIYRMKYLGMDYVTHVRHIQAMVNEYVPAADTAAGKYLRDAILQRKATYADLQAVVPDLKDQPPVHGASLRYQLGKGEIFKRIAYMIDAAQKLIMDMPTDKASRFPFFAESYRRHLETLTRAWYAVDRKDPKSKHVLSIHEVQRLEDQARERAYHDLKYRLYDVTMMTDMARLTRFIVPFSSAIMDSFIKYGRLVKEDPSLVLRGMYYWEMFDREEMVQDENGYVLRKGANGENEWYTLDPETGEEIRVSDDLVGNERYVVFRMPSELSWLVSGQKYFGVPTQPIMQINKRSFNVFLDLAPATGPFVGLPANEFALDNPEFAESEVISKYVLPFGPSTNRAQIALPNTVRTAWEQFSGPDGPRAEAQAKAIFQAELLAYGRGERSQPPSTEEARERAAMMQGLRFMSAWVTPVSFQTMSPYQPYINIYRQMMAEDPEHADEAFLTRYGDEMYAVMMSTTRNLGGMRASIESHKAYERHRDLVAAFPDLAGLITGLEGGTFSKAVYETQKETPIRPGSDETIRQVMSLDETVQELERRRVWNEYTKLMDIITAEMVERGLTSLNQRAARKLRETRNQFIAEHMTWIDPGSGFEAPSPWYEDYSSVDMKAMQKRIAALWQIVQDPDLQKRDDIRGLIDYLAARQEIQAEMQRRRMRSLSSRRARALLSRWRNTSFEIRESSPAFARVWARFLSHDEDLEF